MVEAMNLFAGLALAIRKKDRTLNLSAKLASALSHLVCGSPT
jgi:hypothetical protein